MGQLFIDGGAAPVDALWDVFVVVDGKRKYFQSRCTLAASQSLLASIEKSSKGEVIKGTQCPDDIFPLSALSIENTAIHEAGHVVCAIQLGKSIADIGSASIVPNETMLGSFTSSSSFDSGEGLFAEIIELCGGYAALRVLGFEEEVALSGAEDDFDKASLLIEQYSLDGLELWKRLSISLLAIEANKSAVYLVSEYLHRHKTIGPEFLELLVEVGVGRQQRIEIDDFIAACGLFKKEYWLV